MTDKHESADAVRDKLETFKEDVKDTADELKERAKAKFHETAAEVDKAKREIRHGGD
jgi:hypothetical protein